MDLQSLFQKGMDALQRVVAAAGKPPAQPAPSAPAPGKPQFPQVPVKVQRIQPPPPAPAASAPPENKAVDLMIADVVRREGGYNDDPADAGGATNFGISLRYLKGVGLIKGDLDHDGDIDKDDIRLVTPMEAAEFYKHDFYYEPRIDRLPTAIQEQIFDIAVNSGPPRAITLLQKSIRAVTGEFIAADGVVGPQTRIAAENAISKFGFPRLNNEVVAQRLAWYDAVVKENPADQKFLGGWRNRANSFLVKA